MLNELLDRVTDDDLAIKLNPETTLGQRFAHLIGAEYRMAGYLIHSDDDISDFGADPTSVEDLREKSKLSQKRHQFTLGQLNIEDLDKVWTSKVSGNSYQYKWLLWHFIEHIATHRGQIAMVLNRRN